MKNKTTLIHTKALWCTRSAGRDRNLLRAIEYDLRACIPAGVRGVYYRFPITISAQGSALLLEAVTKMDLSVIL